MKSLLVSTIIGAVIWIYLLSQVVYYPTLEGRQASFIMWVAFYTIDYWMACKCYDLAHDKDKTE